jgi:hypothetical protein
MTRVCRVDRGEPVAEPAALHCGETSADERVACEREPSVKPGDGPEMSRRDGGSGSSSSKSSGCSGASPRLSGGGESMAASAALLWLLLRPLLLARLPLLLRRRRRWAASPNAAAGMGRYRAGGEGAEVWWAGAGRPL